MCSCEHQVYILVFLKIFIDLNQIFYCFFRECMRSTQLSFKDLWWLLSLLLETWQFKVQPHWVLFNFCQEMPWPSFLTNVPTLWRPPVQWIKSTSLWVEISTSVCYFVGFSFMQLSFSLKLYTEPYLVVGTYMHIKKLQIPMIADSRTIFM